MSTEHKIFSPEQIRTNFLLYARMFLENKCWYNDSEKALAEKVLEVVQKVDQHCEGIRKHQKEENY